MTKQTQTKSVAISAKSGRYVTQQYAKTHPATTVVMKVPVPKPSKSK